MDLNKSVNSIDTDYLLKLSPNNFDANDQSFMREIDSYLNDIPTYHQFANTLRNSPTEPDINMQLVLIFNKKIQQLQNKVSSISRENAEKEKMIMKLKWCEVQNEKLSKKIIEMEQEIVNAYSTIQRHEAKNDMMELKIKNLTLTSQESNNLAKNQIKDLQTRLSNCAKAEQEMHKEIEKLSKLKDHLKLSEKEKIKMLEKFETDRQLLEHKHQKIFSSMMNDFSQRERKLTQELNNQREALKNYYQAQLEAALEEKVREYQEQLDKYQSELLLEAKEKSINQFKLIVRKNEEEIDIMQRKCKEENEFYRAQLDRANRTIHSLMESQWKKNLDCLHPMPSLNGEEAELSESDNVQRFYTDEKKNLSQSEENLKSELIQIYNKMSFRNK